MNRSVEIRSTLATAEQAETIDAGGAAANHDDRASNAADWRATYRDHVAYLLNVLQSLGDHDLHERLREQSRQIAELARTVRHQRWAIAALTVALVVGSLIGLATVHIEAATRRASDPGPVTRIERVIDDVAGGADGTYCTDWEPTGEHCSGGCLWYRWCTDCIPGCEWYRETDCRPAPGTNCPFLAPGQSGREDGVAGNDSTRDEDVTLPHTTER